MTAASPQQPALKSSELLDELDHAINDHLAWMKDWHRLIICSGVPSPEDLAYDPHHLCRFGSWYVRNQHRGLVNQPVIRNLARMHKDMHDVGLTLVNAARDGERPDMAQYDRFMDMARGFIIQARRLEKAFATASSDLDPLTGLHNRQAMIRDLERERDRFKRMGHPCCVALADLDFFKKVNDTYGHAAGDRVLERTAETLLGGLRPYDSIYRYGGEEFVLLLPEATLADALIVLERLREAVESTPIKIDSGENLRVTGSFGAAALSAEYSIETTLEQADQALYEAKETGRNRVIGWDGPPEVEGL
ncbi:MAG: diguanylate cyclase [Magnetovibrionaceae bacterium]